MPEPTDHRALAEDFLGEAPRSVNRGQAELFALIGIGHALLALGQAPPTSDLAGEEHLSEEQRQGIAEQVRNLQNLLPPPRNRTAR